MSTATVGILAAFGWLSLGAQDAKSPQEEALRKLAASLPSLIKAADTDGNGTLNKVEFRAFAPAARKAGEAALNAIDPSIAQKKAAKELKKYDTNVNGKIDDTEKKAMDEALRLKGIKNFDWDGDGKLNEHEKTAMGWAEEGKLDGLFLKTDTDMNGEAGKDEIAAALSIITGIKVKKA